MAIDLAVVKAMWGMLTSIPFVRTAVSWETKPPTPDGHTRSYRPDDDLFLFEGFVFYGANFFLRCKSMRGAWA